MPGQPRLSAKLAQNKQFYGIRTKMTGVDILSDGATPTFIEIFYCGFRQNTRNIFKNDNVKRILLIRASVLITVFDTLFDHSL